MERSCEDLTTIIVEALETGLSGSVRNAISNHCSTCDQCSERSGTLDALAAGLDPEQDHRHPGFVSRVMEEIRGLKEANTGPYDRLPPAWQIIGALSLLVALTAVVLATGKTEEWRQHLITGFLDQALNFLGVLSHGMTNLWETVAPGRGLPVLIGCAIAATILNAAFAFRAIKRKRETVDS